jgi:hypothetical protein
MGHKITIYLSERTKAILKGMEGETASSKVRVALEAFNHEEGVQLAHAEGRMGALRRQVKMRDNLLRKIGLRRKLTPKFLNEIRDLYLLEGLE